ncbi:TonB-dependent receptor [uncultured Brevundimonas sp.]|uniref:TonB-dependent receptor n=1 Tax=uncultured Brevundimonas sp. TaxID=213418 RepID=UPI002639E347|nr:TonB-dependent receptor [uncultured Brevundimonas sp.]
MTRKSKQYLGAASALAVAISLAAAGGAAAQVATSTIRGSVTDEGQAEAGATIVARDVASGFTNRTTANAEGGYVLSGLRPGTYEITVTTSDGETASEVVTIGVGQVGEVDLSVGAAVVSETVTTNVGDVVVTGRRLVEVRTPEIATNVTTQQINTLPQINRNFLNFAALAPGVRVSANEQEQTITAGGQRAESVNAFIDGASLKSNIIDGGIAGQDDSRGNPFPQAGIQEFRVVSQNFKAEYEQASSAIITAVTRSGTNEFHGEVFGTYRDQNFIAQDEFAERRGDEQANLEVKQYGAALGGPILRDRLHFFGTYERKEEGRAAVINLGRQDQRFVDQFGQYIGTFGVPFEEDLYFGKLSWQPADEHLLDLSVTWRDEFDTRNIGGADSAERATELNQTTLTINGRHQWQTDVFTNELIVTQREYNYNPQPVNFSSFGETYRLHETDTDPGAPGFQVNYFGGVNIINLGGADSRQDIVDEVLTFRDDLTFNEIEWNGFHTIKMGAKFSRQNYQVTKEFGRNPLFYYDVDGRSELSGSTTVPYRVELGNAFPSVDLTNNVYGLYIQDDWQVTDKLELNLGIRWDYEDNANNNDYVTPQSVIDGLNQWIASTDGGKPAGYAPSWFDVNDYIATGNNRDPFANAFQPRLGFSYDVFGDRSTVIFGGAGRYYDRVQFNFSFDEIVKPFDFRQNVFFSTTGRPPGVASGNAGDPILWDESYRTVEGLDALLDTIPAKGEAFLLANDFEPPRTDQFNIGVRQRLGDWQTELTLAYGKTENEFTWQYLNRCREPLYGNDGDGYGDHGGFCGPSGSNPYRAYLVSDHNKEREFTALYLKADKPYTRESGWGFNLAYTWSESLQNGGNDNFCFDCFSIETSPMRSSANDETHRIVANGIVDLPWDFQLSGILTLGSGSPFNVFDGSGSQFYFRPYARRPEKYGFLLPDAFAYRNLDLRLTKNFEVFNGQELSLFVDAINVFNFDNYTGFDGGTGSATNPNPNFGRPSAILFPTRTFQVGMRYSF